MSAPGRGRTFRRPDMTLDARWAVVVIAVAGAALAQGRFPTGPGHLRNAAQGLCLDVAGWNGAGDGNALLWECNGDPDQVWSFTPGGELVNALGSCLDVAEYDGAPGRNVDVYRCEGLDDQKWSLVPAGGDRFLLHNRKQSLCLDVAGKNGNKGDNVALWHCDGGKDQLWSWEPVVVEAPRRRPPGDPPEYTRPERLRPEIVREQPVPLEQVVISGRDLEALLKAVDSEGFSQGKLRVIETA